jgi:hypothetical protein
MFRHPKGRPRQAKGQATILNRILDEIVIVTENGKRRKKSKREVMYMQIVNKTLSGDSRSAKLLFDKLERMEEKDEIENGRPISMAVLDRLRARLDQKTIPDDESDAEHH